MPDQIRATDEFQRIDALPRRIAADVLGDDPDAPGGFVDQLTEMLRTPTGTMRLRPLQALALHDIGTCGGGFLPLDVGEGKTLISLLAALVLQARTPLMLLPANLIEKTARERDKLAEHWRIPKHIRLMSYTTLGLADHDLELEQYAPDLIIADESQKLKNPDAAVTRRVSRYMTRHPETRFVAMTGTIMRKSIRDFAHIVAWCLKFGAPVPLKRDELDEWALCLDDRIENEFQRVEPGALLRWASASDVSAYGALVAARRGYRRRLRETPGIVSSADTGTEVTRTVPGPDGGKRRKPVGLVIRALRYDISRTCSGHFQVLRDDKVTPDGWPLWEASQVWMHAKELALGFHGIWDPRPPDEWRNARREWFSFVREVLSRHRTLDSPEHVARACDAGRLPGEALARWRAVKDTFTPNPVPVWHDDSALRVAAAWMRQGPGIVWTEHVAFAERLAALTGATYYGAKGFSADGRFVDDGDASAAIIVSVDANREGRNLQHKWSRNLVTSPAEGADLWQQLLGRTHRPGQHAAEVTCDVFLGCAEHARAWSKAVAGAYSIRDTVGSENKLLIALEGRARGRVEWPSQAEIDSWQGPRWGKTED